MSRVVDIDKWNLKRKRKKNQFINELINQNYINIKISKKQFKNIHKQEIINMFNDYGWNYETQGLIEDGISIIYMYK